MKHPVLLEGTHVQLIKFFVCHQSKLSKNLIKIGQTCTAIYQAVVISPGFVARFAGNNNGKLELEPSRVEDGKIQNKNGNLINILAYLLLTRYI